MLTYSLKTGELDTDLHAFVSDAERFVSSFVGTMSEFPLQIYCSALLFAPSRSLVRRLLLHDIPPWISHVPEGQSDWSGQEVTIETGRQDVSTQVWGHDGELTTLSNENVHSSLSFSPDGKLVASCSPLNGVSFWDPTTGALRGAIPGSGQCFKMSACFLDIHFLAYYR
jgi:WD40 repeat protein